MNDKEIKMIKEMAEILIDAQDKCELNPCNECEHQGCREGCWHYLSATELYKKGGRIVADDEIVESMKTYERARQETAREILQVLWDKRLSLCDLEVAIGLLLDKYDIELED